MSEKKHHVFQRVGDTPIIPISAKLLVIFIMLLLLSNLLTNFITLSLSQRKVIQLTNEILVGQLKTLYTTADNQYQISLYSQDEETSLSALRETAESDFSQNHSLALGVRTDGSILFAEARNMLGAWYRFSDEESLATLNKNLSKGQTEGTVSFKGSTGDDYFGVYKYHPQWECFIIRAELRSDTQDSMLRVMLIIVPIIIVFIIIFLVTGIVMFSRLFANVRHITSSLYRMQENQKLGLIDISDAPNDDITYLAASFNSLSSNIDNLLTTFQKFVSQDVVERAYSEQAINLEGKPRDLTILFSDIKSFTYRTEVLGNDIIDLLNVHYDKVIRIIQSESTVTSRNKKALASTQDNSRGIIGSIIGDAILGIYGLKDSRARKSVDAIQSAWEIIEATKDLRGKMSARRQQIESERKLSASELRVFDAVMLEVGVGIDGGEVFYGTIGSNDHMTNTVIGDRVNSASRLEGLTREYKVPIIVSGYVKDEVLSQKSLEERYKFFEIDTVQVKGKTEGMKVYFPYDSQFCDSALVDEFEIYEKALKLYYDGKWKESRALFRTCTMPVATVFLDRMGLKKAPEDWSGIWTMKTK